MFTAISSYSRILFIVLLWGGVGSAHALSVEAEGTAPIVDNAPGKARISAIQNAIRQAAMQNSVEISTLSTMSNSSVTGDTARLRTTGNVSKVTVADEWTEDGIYHVLIRAEVTTSNSTDSAAPRQRKKVAFMQLLIRDRGAAADLAYIEIELPRMLRKDMESRHDVIGIDGSKYVLTDSTASVQEQSMLPDRELVMRAAKELGTQFVVSGSVLDTGMSDDTIGNARRIEVEFMLFDGVSGSMLARSRFSESVVGAELAKPGTSVSNADFLKTPYGHALQEILHRAGAAIAAEVNRLPFTAHVIRANANKVYFDAGATAQIRVGDMLLAYKVSDDKVTDPANGAFLGYAEHPVATLVVRSVQPQFSVGELETDKIQLKPGDLLRFGW